MATPSARFVIGFDADTSGIDQSKSKLDSLKSTIEKDTKALTEMKAAMERLKGTAEVTRFQALPKDIAKADNEVKKLEARAASLKTKMDAAPPGKKDAIAAEAAKAQADLEKAKAHAAGLRKEQAALAKTEPVRLFQDLQAGAEKTKANLGQAQTAFSRMGGTMTGETTKAAGAMEQLSEASSQLPGPLGNIASTFQKLKGLGPAALVVAVVVAVIALGVAVATAIVKLTAFSITMSDAARSAALLREANAVGSASATDLKNATVAVMDKTNAQEEAVSSLVAEYSRLRFSLNAIEGATSAVTIATQTMGAAAGSTIKGLIDRGVDTKRFWLNALDLKGTGLAFREVSTQLAKQMKISVGAAEAALRDGRVKLEDGIKALDSAVEARFGEVAKRQMLALPTQIERLKKNLANLFGGAKIEGFLEQLNETLSVFKETSTVGKAIKQILSVVFQPLIDSATGGLPLVEGFIYGVVIAIQELTIIGLKAAIAIKKMFGGSVFKDMDLLKLGMYAGVAAVGLMVAMVGALIAVFAALGTMVAIVTAPIWALPAAVGAAIAAVISLKEKIGNALGGDSAGGVDAGNNVTDGVVKGIQDGTPAVDAAMKDMAKSGVKAFESELKMASPSKLLAAKSEIGIAGGVAKGIDKGKPQVARSLARLVDPADVNTGEAAQTLMARAQSAAGNVINVVLNYMGAGTRADAIQFRQMLEDEIETSNLAAGRAG
jgi:hypothetical protein